MNLKSMSQIFKSLFQTGDIIIIFVLRGVFFSRYVQLKSYPFLTKKTSAVKSETQVEKLTKINVAKY